MRRTASNHRFGHVRWLALSAALALAPGAALAMAQDPEPDVLAPAAAPPAPATAPAAPDGSAATAVPALPAEVQVVEFLLPDGVQVEVLGPTPEPLPAWGAPSGPRFGLKVGIGYYLRLTNLPERPGAELYPVLELVGHLHRPAEVDPGRFPIRVAIGQEDLDDTIVLGRLVTHVVYLEDPDQALPMSLPKNQVPVVTISPAEDPLRVGAALGRPMAVVRLGGRIPNPEEWTGAPTRTQPLVPCRFTGSSGRCCELPCGPGRNTTPQAGGPWLPRDEYLCDGGDHGESASFGTYGHLRGIDPRDALIQFETGSRPRVLPTNTVCMYAPRFAVVRSSVGVSAALNITEISTSATVQQGATEARTQAARKFTQNQSAEANRHHARASSMASRILPFGHTELRILQGYDTVTHVAGNITSQLADTSVARQKGHLARRAEQGMQIRTAESVVVTGIVQSGSQTVMSWNPREVVGVEEPPKRPGLAVLKRVSAAVAEPGDVVTYTIQFRNMGNIPIAAVSVIDSLLPRLEYVAGSAQGPKGSVFTATDNIAGSTELRWDLPGAIAPGAEGSVTFQARVR
jgi:uncharacterized repeat protein (TIGR01451 family)